MTEMNMKRARRQVEAMADGSLTAADERRMRAALERDPELRRAVAEARALRAALRGLAREGVPPALARRLLRAAGTERPRAAAVQGAWSWASAAVVAGAAAGLLLVLMQPMRTTGSSEDEAAALRDFAVAMTYLRRSSAIVRQELNEAVEGGLREALDATLDRTGEAGDRQREKTE
ncbi:MAG: hypothetical protein JXB36_07885 [Gammaproteobacteria bacterium]|nr:hypothetical protein [Gammaproteobacteria bacterium]